MAFWFSAATFIATTGINKLKLLNNGGTELNSITTTPQFNFFSVIPTKTKCKRRLIRGNNITSSLLCISSNLENQTQTTLTQSKKSSKRISHNQILSLGREGDEFHGDVCPGCGVFMQDRNPNLPGFYQKKKSQNKETKGGVFFDNLEDGVESKFDLEDGVESKFDLEVGVESKFDLEDGVGSKFDLEVGVERNFDLEDGVENKFDLKDGNESEFDLEDGSESEFEEMEEGVESKLEGSDDEEGDIDWDLYENWEIEDEVDENIKKELDGFTSAGVGYGNVTEEVLEKNKKIRVSKAEKKRKFREQQAMRDGDEVTVCARCHSLRNYGQVKNQNAENLIPDFDFDRLITTRLMKPIGNSNASVVVMVIDCVDFDGSFPKRAAKSLFKALEGTKKDSKLKLPKLVLVATKVDLLPSQISPTRLDKWVRNRARASGAPKISGVYLVSARKDLGVRNLLSYIKGLAGPRGNVWVIGAQNAGKSTLINAFAKKEGTKITKLTEAAVPGTTLGILRIGGILPAKAKMDAEGRDTPRVPNGTVGDRDRLWSSTVGGGAVGVTVDGGWWLESPGPVGSNLDLAIVGYGLGLGPHRLGLATGLPKQGNLSLRVPPALLWVVSMREPRSWSVVVVTGPLALACTPISSTSRISASTLRIANGLLSSSLLAATLPSREAGQAIHVGALMRLDLTQASVDTIYVTVWASSNISLHLGKIENAEEFLSKHAGIRLQPPAGEDRVSELGEWDQKQLKVSGISWDVNSIDIAAAGLGWFSLGLKGEATVTLWTYEGIEIVLREPLVLDRAPFLERPGFLLPKSISEAIGSQSKLEAENKKKKKYGSIDSVLEMTV
ncbi:hypothetical protein GIB67_042615 [Kingdonia uniflora]|uniref:Uncharacterized protein n=1 Tax=Kingdonia uniflora TaxID=39325 RepID=A0A7J7M1A7_9MAGN|nr:hypothetical protein GIB67_042615 [Kingdonia uniflora]